METPEQQLARLEQKVDAMYASVEKTRKYLLAMVIITVVTVALPLLAAVLIVPAMISSLGSAYGV